MQHKPNQTSPRLHTDLSEKVAPEKGGLDQTNSCRVPTELRRHGENCNTHINLPKFVNKELNKQLKNLGKFRINKSNYPVHVAEQERREAQDHNHPSLWKPFDLFLFFFLQQRGNHFTETVPKLDGVGNVDRFRFDVGAAASSSGNRPSPTG